MSNYSPKKWTCFNVATSAKPYSMSLSVVFVFLILFAYSCGSGRHRVETIANQGWTRRVVQAPRCLNGGNSNIRIQVSSGERQLMRIYSLKSIPTTPGCPFYFPDMATSLPWRIAKDSPKDSKRTMRKHPLPWVRLERNRFKIIQDIQASRCTLTHNMMQ